ncbi:MAG: hypothetical protein R3F11_18880 [Verrucomicrobiales bacterium]
MPPRGSVPYTKAQVEQAVARRPRRRLDHAGKSPSTPRTRTTSSSRSTRRAFAAVSLPLDGGFGMPGQGWRRKARQTSR